MGSSNIPNNTHAMAQGQAVIEGVAKHFATSVMILGVTYTPTELKAVFQSDIDATKAADASRAQFLEKVAEGRAARAKAREVRAGLRTYVLGTAGPQAVSMLKDF